MKYFVLIWAGLWRKRMRTILTLLSIAVAFVLYGILDSVTASFDDVIAQMSDTRLRTMSRVNIIEPLPVSLTQQIQTVDGVLSVAHYTIFFGYYQDPSNGVGIGAVSGESFLNAFSDLELPQEQREAFLRTRTGALVGEQLAEEHGWSLGDRIGVTSRRFAQSDGSFDWTFEVAGIYSFGDLPANEIWVNYDYFDEARTSGNGTVNLIFEQIDDPARAARIGEDVDRLFLNSSNETQTQSEQEWIRAQINQIGDIEFFVNAIIGAVLFTLLFLTSNTMMQSVRERVPELAVLKTYGFSDAAVIALVCAEALILCVVAAGLGLAVASAIFPKVFAMMNAPALPMPWSIVAFGLGLAVLLALVSAATPAWRVRRLNLVDALAGR
jgi:putative ABC transport system permease protein